VLSVDKSWIGGYPSTYFKMHETKFGTITNFEKKKEVLICQP
jgi:hypothetical protein